MEMQGPHTACGPCFHYLATSRTYAQPIGMCTMFLSHSEGSKMIKSSLQGKICLVTGTTSGIGKVTARELANMSAHSGSSRDMEILVT